MKTQLLKRSALALAPAALLALTSCTSTVSSPFDASNPNASYQPGVPGGVVVETRKLTATVDAIDAENRTVTLETKDGEKTTVKCGPEAINFDQVHVGDKLKVVVTAELAVAMADANNPPPADSGAAAVVLAPKGAKPGGIVAETKQITATLTGIDLLRHHATFRFPDGSIHTVEVRPDVDLTQRKLGDQVIIRATMAIALSVRKP
jgi:hypothetical protein